MIQVNLLDAKEQFANLVEMLEKYQTDEVILVYKGDPVIKMTRANRMIPAKRRLGVAKGKFTIDDELFDKLDEDVLAMFEEAV